MADAVNNYMSLNPGQISELIDLCMAQDKPLMIHGAPGVGKSSIVVQAAAKRDLPCLCFSLTLMEPVDIKGIPVVNDARTEVRWVPLGELPTEGEGILFLDEINTADPSVMAASMRLILERKIGEYTLPPGWRIIAAGNRVEDGASANRIPTALADRFTHVCLETSFDDWERWAIENNMPHVLIAFLNFRKDLLHDFDAKQTVNTTPRGWADVGQVVSGDPALRSMASLAYVSGRVGQGPAAELRGFMNVWGDLPSIDKIIDGTIKDAGNIEKPAVRYAIALALSFRMQPGNLRNILDYIDQVGVEFTKMALVTAMKRDISISRDPEYLQWATKGRRAA